MSTAVVGPFPPYRGGIAQFSERLLSTVRKEYPAEAAEAISYRRLYPSPLFPGRSQFEPDAGSIRPEDRGTALIDSIDPLGWRRARKTISGMGLDRIVVMWWHPFFAPCLSRSIPLPSSRSGHGGRPKLAAVCHNVFPHEWFPLGRTLARSFLSRMDLLVVHSDADLELASGIPGERRILRLFHPVYDQYLDGSVDRMEARSALGYGEGDRVLLFFGLVRPYKGLFDLLDALPMLPADVKLLVAGECYGDSGDLKTKLASVSPPERVRWIDGFVPDGEVAELFEAADVVALPYRTATQSGVAQIALSFGKPLVLTRTGGLPDLVDDGTTGVLTSPCDPEDLARGVLEALELAREPGTASAVLEKSKQFGWGSYALALMEALE